MPDLLQHSALYLSITLGSYPRSRLVAPATETDTFFAILASTLLACSSVVRGAVLKLKDFEYPLLAMTDRCGGIMRVWPRLNTLWHSIVLETRKMEKE